MQLTENQIVSALKNDIEDVQVLLDEDPESHLLFGYVISQHFAGKPDLERDGIIHSILKRAYGSEAFSDLLLEPHTPDEINEMGGAA